MVVIIIKFKARWSSCREAGKIYDFGGHIKPFEWSMQDVMDYVTEKAVDEKLIEKEQDPRNDSIYPVMVEKVMSDVSGKGVIYVPDPRRIYKLDEKCPNCQKQFFAHQNREGEIITTCECGQAEWTPEEKEKDDK